MRHDWTGLFGFLRDERGEINGEYVTMGVFIVAVVVVAAMVAGVVYTHNLDIMSKTVSNSNKEMMVMERGHFNRFTLPDYIEDSEEYLKMFSDNSSGMGGKQQDFTPYLGD